MSRFSVHCYGERIGKFGFEFQTDAEPLSEEFFSELYVQAPCMYQFNFRIEAIICIE